MDFGCFSAAAFAECQRRLARNGRTENVKNMQIPAEICTNQTQPKTQRSKLQSTICKLQTSVLHFWLQYFDCLPTKLDTWCGHSIWKIISTSRRIFWDGFQPFLKNAWFSVSSSSLQYFDCLPIEQDTWCSHSIWKIISASRRIFWDGFQPFLKNT